MKEIFNSNGICLKIELDTRNDINGMFGIVHFTLNNHYLTWNVNHNLSYLYVGFDALIDYLKSHELINNELYNFENKIILEYYREWNELNKDILNIEKETFKAIFFNNWYFRSKNYFNNSFFDGFFILFITTRERIKFKYWEEVEPLQIFEADVPKRDFILCLQSFLRFFKEYEDSFKTK